MQPPLIFAAYEEAFFYESGPYQDFLVGTLLAHLRLGERPETLRLVDVGALAKGLARGAPQSLVVRRIHGRGFFP